MAKATLNSNTDPASCPPQSQAKYLTLVNIIQMIIKMHIKAAIKQH
ncbi:hypothetical protein SOHN41_01922 [Shewanella sp. HN-41]|nr:hypothetical protein SOHN41_01922 [Shewanella sp. HN-41]